MGLRLRWSLAIIFCGCSVLGFAASDCPARPAAGTIVNNPFSISSQNGALSASFTLAHSVDQDGYTHYCYKFETSAQTIEAPTLRLNPGDTLNLEILDRIQDDDKNAKKMKMKMSSASGKTCGDGGDATLDSTNVHFHGLNVPPVCHQDDVLDTLIQPGSPGFKFSMQIPDGRAARPLLVPSACARLHGVSGERRRGRRHRGRRHGKVSPRGSGPSRTHLRNSPAIPGPLGPGSLPVDT